MSRRPSPTNSKEIKHLFKPGNECEIYEIQAEVDKRWEELVKLAENN